LVSRLAGATIFVGVSRWLTRTKQAGTILTRVAPAFAILTARVSRWRATGLPPTKGLEACYQRLMLVS
ncbi:MAG: hypothetical protein V3T61_09530, partial [Acidobacteriota bacterium]